VLFADVSGYTAMCEKLGSLPGGDELLSQNLNSYFELLVRSMSKQGGDVFKFAGDAIIVVWPPSDKEDLATLTRRAGQVLSPVCPMKAISSAELWTSIACCCVRVQCAMDIKESLQDAVLGNHGVRLSVKVGFGAGEITILHLGKRAVTDRMFVDEKFLLMFNFFRWSVWAT